MKIVFPYRFNIRLFFFKRIFKLGIVGGLSGKCFWIYVMNADGEEYLRRKELIKAFYRAKNSFDIKKKNKLFDIFTKK